MDRATLTRTSPQGNPYNLTVREKLAQMSQRLLILVGLLARDRDDHTTVAEIEVHVGAMIQFPSSMKPDM